jgi:quercetin dioxygenase-like cupin family protein
MMPFTHTKIYKPKHTPDVTEGDFHDIMDTLQLAHNQSPVNMYGILDPDDLTVIKAFKGDDVCMEGLYKGRYLSACLVYVNQKSVIANHYHETAEEACYEIVYCLTGDVNIEMEETDGQLVIHRLVDKDIMIIPKGRPHSLSSSMQSILLCIAVPADPYYPSDSNHK